MAKHDQSPKEEWRKLLLTEEEREARIREDYHIDPDTGEILGEKLTFSQIAVQRGIDLNPKVNVWDYANELFEIMEREK